MGSLMGLISPVKADHPSEGELDPNVTYRDIIPPVNYGTRNGVYIGEQYPPVAVANKCLFYFSYVQNATAWKYGEYVAKWLALRAHQEGDTIYFTYDFAWKAYNLDAGWKSGMAQGLAAECFIKAYKYNGDSTFLDLAKRSLMYLEVPMEEGGVMVEECHGRWWYELYAGIEGSQPRVLNGHQFVLLSIDKYLKVDNDRGVRKLFDKGLAALKFDATMYDNGNANSFYDRLRNPANNYHQAHVVNFQKLYDITQDEELLKIKGYFAR